MMNEIDRDATIVIAITFVLLGIYALTWSKKRLRYRRISKSFKKTEGEIVKSSVLGTGGYEGIPVVKYEYNVEGKKYFSNKISFWWSDKRQTIFDSESIKKINNLYPKSTIVPVHYDPKDPRFAVLDKEFSKDACYGCKRFILYSYLGITAGLLSLLIMFYLYFL